jgi:hypothetical protein
VVVVVVVGGWMVLVEEAEGEGEEEGKVAMVTRQLYDGMTKQNTMNTQPGSSIRTIQLRKKLDRSYPPSRR